MTDSLLGPAAIASAVHATLDAAFKAIPADKSHAVIIDAVTDQGGTVRGMFVQRTANGWNVVLEGEVSGQLGAAGAAGAVVVAKAW